jgi:anthranilate synthase/aminodeoxychorismate synthase-like glutamine amidotransferase
VLSLILIIDHFDSFSHNLYQLLAAQGPRVLVCRCDQIDLPSITSLEPELIVLSPGPKGPEDTGITTSLLRSKWAKSKAIVGVCLGFQALAKAWGGAVERAPAVVHGKTLQLETPEHPFFKGLQNPLQVARYHSLCVPVSSLPQNVEVLAQYEGMAMAVLDRERPWVGLQFHPESFLTPQGAGLLLNIRRGLSC